MTDLSAGFFTMQTEVLQVNSSNITLPLNQSVQRSNGAQFALMLSLLYESKVEQAAASNPLPSQFPALAETTSVSNQLPAPEFNLETSQTRALQNNQQTHFHLLHSLYAERSTRIDPALQTSTADGVLQEINQGQGSPSASREAERVSFTTPAHAA